MAENPLLPHRKLREMHALMQRCRELERKQKTSSPAREALLAATSIHLVPGDLLSARTGDFTAAQLAPPARALPHRLALCAAAARGLQAAGTDGLVLSFTHADASEPGWQAALEWAQSAKLPLLLACTAALSTRPPRAFATKTAKSPSFHFDAVSHIASRLKLPVVTVDGEDAVAVYRVMQESVLRARLGGGPAVLWAWMSPSPKLSRAHQPLQRLETYLAARKISLPA